MRFVHGEPTQSFTRRPVNVSKADDAHTSRPHWSALNTRSGDASSTSRSPIVGAKVGRFGRWDRVRSFMLPRIVRVASAADVPVREWVGRATIARVIGRPVRSLEGDGLASGFQT